MPNKNWTKLGAYFSPKRYNSVEIKRLNDEFPANALVVVKGFAGQKSVVLRRSGGWTGTSSGDTTGRVRAFMKDAAGNHKTIRAEDMRRPRIRLLAWLQYNTFGREALKNTEAYLDFGDPMQARPRMPSKKSKLEFS